MSVGLPVFNGEKTIRRALESLIAQSYPNVEIIISDNCSTDLTYKICAEYADRYSRIKLNKNAENIGLISNTDEVLFRANGKYYMQASDDDYWYPDFIEKLVRVLMSKPDVGVVLPATERVYSDGSMKDVLRFEGRNNPYKMGRFQLANNVS